MPAKFRQLSKSILYRASGRPGPVVVDIPKDATNPAEKFCTNILKSEDAFVSATIPWSFRSNP